MSSQVLLNLHSHFAYWNISPVEIRFEKHFGADLIKFRGGAAQGVLRTRPAKSRQKDSFICSEIKVARAALFYKWCVKTKGERKRASADDRHRS